VLISISYIIQLHCLSHLLVLSEVRFSSQHFSASTPSESMSVRHGAVSRNLTVAQLEPLEHHKDFSAPLCRQRHRLTPATRLIVFTCRRRVIPNTAFYKTAMAFVTLRREESSREHTKRPAAVAFIIHSNYFEDFTLCLRTLYTQKSL
jgi:hypothetical protein